MSSLDVAIFYNKIKEIPMNNKVVINKNTPMRYKRNFFCSTYYALKNDVKIIKKDVVIKKLLFIYFE